MFRPDKGGLLSVPRLLSSFTNLGTFEVLTKLRELKSYMVVGPRGLHSVILRECTTSLV